MYWLCCTGKFFVTTDDGKEVVVEMIFDSGICAASRESFGVQELTVDDSVDSINSVEIPMVPNLSRFLKRDFNNNDQSGSIMTTAEAESESSENDRGDPDYVPEVNEDSQSNDSDNDVSQIPQHTMIDSSRHASGSSAGPQSIPLSDGYVPANLNAAASVELRDIDATPITSIVVMTTNNAAGRKYDKTSFCYFCNKPQSKLVRHLRKKHNTERMVADLSDADKEKRDMAIMKLRNLGNHSHNQSVIQKGEGDFMVVYRPHGNADYRNYVPCKYCYGYFLKAAIWKHACPFAPTSDDGTRLRGLRKAATGVSTLTADATSAFAGMLNGMRQDDVGTVASTDALVLQLGQRLCTKFGGDREQFSYVRCKMRQVAKLLLTLRQSSGQMSASVSDFLIPTKFQEVMAAAQQCAGLNDSGSQYAAPSSAMKSGGVIRCMAELKQSNALRHGDPETAELCNQFLKLCDINWSTEVSAVAARNLTERKRNGVSFMPLTEDVVKLNDYLVLEASRLMECVDDSTEAFLSLTQVVLAKVILFNRKRQGEVSKIKVQDYEKKTKSNNTDAALSLNDFEQALLKTLTRVEIKGKRERTVPILMTEEMVTWVDKLIAVRKSFVSADNPYLFANVGDYSHFRGSDALRKFAGLCGAAKPMLLTSTKLRKNIASMAQVLSLKEHEMDSLATFMGHDIRVHRQYYRMPLDVVQIAKVSKIFLAAENGRIAEYAGKELNDISLDPKEDIVEDSNDDSDCSEVDKETREVGAADTSAQVNMSDRVAITQSVSASKMKRSRSILQRKPWSDAEKEAVRSYFAPYIIERKLPGKQCIEEFLKTSGIDRQWTKVKDHIRNHYLT